MITSQVFSDTVMALKVLSLWREAHVYRAIQQSHTYNKGKYKMYIDDLEEGENWSGGLFTKR